MSSMPPLRAPAADGSVLAVPPLEQAGELLEVNFHRLKQFASPLFDRPGSEMRDLARREMIEAARRYLAPFAPLRQERETVNKTEGAPHPLFVAGHQPELFHPGVWVKNFALAGLARRHGGAAVNLVVDNDTLKSPAVRIPVPATRQVPRAHAISVPFDRWGPETPFEERSVRDAGLFASFGDRATEMVRRWGYEPILPAFWAAVLRHVSVHGLIGEAFAGARRELERSWGCHNLEVPLSVVCRTESFACFVGAVLGELPRFVATYNQIVRDYRVRNGIRSRHHPVPDLARDGDWLEAPFWGWRAGQGRRERLFVRRLDDRLQVRAGAEPWPDLPVPSRPDFAEVLRGLAGDGYKVRSRALTTTLFARLLLADLFLHGIGGGKYDELTDELMRRYFGVEPPAFLVLSATRWLPLPAFPVAVEDRRRFAHRLRELHYNPQRYLSAQEAGNLAGLLRDREEWIERHPGDSAGRRERFAVLRGITEQLHRPLREEEARLREELARMDGELKANAVLRRRDYAFCLYPESVLRPFCTRLL